MSDLAIRVEGLGKRYRIGQREPYRALRDVLAGAAAAPLRRLRGEGRRAPETIWALKDVSFEVKRGEVLGIIGRNGAGKSTLLKILSRITAPTEGAVNLYGRVGSLLEVGTGFHPELTGRENIYLNGAILGMKRAEIRRRFDEMVAFAEIEPFLDTPVKRYSSGMFVRLAFAVAAHLEPEILLVDEVLAVGDAAFQRKCLGKMGEVARGGRTVLFVSHNMAAIGRLCSRSLWLSAGALALEGSSLGVITRYQSESLADRPEWERGRSPLPLPEFAFLAVSIEDTWGRPKALFAGDEPISVVIHYAVREELAACQVGVRVHSAEGAALFTTADTDITRTPAAKRVPGRYRSHFVIPGGLLTPGSYTLLVAAHSPRVRLYDKVENAITFTISPVGSLSSLDGRLGSITPVLIWETVPIASADHGTIG